MNVSYVANDPLTIAEVQDARVTPARFADDWKTFVGGVYGAAGLVRESRREAANAAVRPTDPRQPGPATWSARLRGAWLYGGWLHVHFGHFMLESLARLWPLPRLGPDVSILYHPWAGVTPDTVRATPSVRQMLAALGVDWSRIRLVEEHTLIDRLIVPAPAFRINTAAHPRMNEIFDGIAAAAAPELSAGTSSGRVYLTRRKLPTHLRHAAGEDRIEAVFERHGFSVVAPEALTMAEQIRLVRSAHVVAGLDGSALHLVAFARPGTVVVLLETRDYGHENQFALNELRGAQTVEFEVGNERGDEVYAALDAALAQLRD